MTKNNVPNEMVSGSPCAKLVDQVRLARKTWTALYASLEACFIKIKESKDSVLDPFGVLQVVAEIRSDVALVAQVGEEPLAQAENWAREQAQNVTLVFDQELRKLSTEANVSVEGRFPSYVLDGWLILRISSDNRTTTVGARKVESLHLERVWPEITAALKEEKARAVTPDKFIGSCQEAYKRAVALGNARMGSSLPIRKLFRELVVVLQSEKFWRAPKRSNLAEYTEEHFCRDLARLVAAGRYVTPDGAKMELMPTAFPKDGMPLYLTDGVRFIGHVKFEEPPL
jgi:hypothetical protein